MKTTGRSNLRYSGCSQRLVTTAPDQRFRISTRLRMSGLFTNCDDYLTACITYTGVMCGGWGGDRGVSTAIGTHECHHHVGRLMYGPVTPKHNGTVLNVMLTLPITTQKECTVKTKSLTGRELKHF